MFVSSQKSCGNDEDQETDCHNTSGGGVASSPTDGSGAKAMADLMTRVRMRTLASFSSHLASRPSCASAPPCTIICKASRTPRR